MSHYQLYTFGVQTEQQDRKTGGFAVQVKKRLQSSGIVTMKEHFCIPDIELLASSFCSYFLLTQDFVALVTFINNIHKDRKVAQR